MDVDGHSGRKHPNHMAAPSPVSSLPAANRNQRHREQKILDQPVTFGAFAGLNCGTESRPKLHEITLQRIEVVFGSTVQRIRETSYRRRGTSLSGISCDDFLKSSISAAGITDRSDFPAPNRNNRIFFQPPTRHRLELICRLLSQDKQHPVQPSRRANEAVSVMMRSEIQIPSPSTPPVTRADPRVCHKEPDWIIRCVSTLASETTPINQAAVVKDRAAPVSTVTECLQPAHGWFIKMTIQSPPTGRQS